MLACLAFAEMPRRQRPDGVQLDLFVADLVDVPVKGERETLSLPFFSLSKSKRTRMTYRHDSVVVDIAAPEHIGVATIWDSDVLLWAASELVAARERGRDLSPRMRLSAYELLHATGRHSGKGDYDQLRQTLSRLTATTVRTNVHSADGERVAEFHWLEGWREHVDEKGRSQWLE